MALEEQPEVDPVLTAVPETALKLGMDAIQIQVLPSLFVDKVVSGGEACVAGGRLTSHEALKKAKLPDPDDEALMNKISGMIDRI